MRIISLFSLIVFVCAAAFCGCVSGDDAEKLVIISNNDSTNWTYLVNNLSSPDSKVTVRLECDFNNSSFRRGITNPLELLTKGLAVIDISSGNKTLDLNGHNINLNSTNFAIPKNDYWILFNVTNGSSFKINNSDLNNKSCIAANVSTLVSVWTGGDFTLGENVNLTTYGKPNPPPPIPSGLPVFPSGYDYNTSMVIAIQGQDGTASDIINVKLNESSTVFDNVDYDNDYTIGIVHKGYPNPLLNNKASGVNLTICGNVTGHRGIWLDAGAKDFTFYPNITINSSAVIDAYRGCAVYAAGYGNWIFNGGKLNGTEALSIRSGNFTIKGGTFKGSGDYYDPPKRFSDMKLAYFTGAAISIVNNSSDINHVSNVSISIEKGTFESKNGYAFLETFLNGGSALGIGGITIYNGTFITHNSSKLYPIYIRNLNNNNVSVTINKKTLLYPYLNLSAANWTEADGDNWNVTLNKDISNLKSINLTLINANNNATLKLNGGNITSSDGKLLGWNNTSDSGKVINVPQISLTEFKGGKEYYPLFGHYVFFNNSSGSGTMDDQPFVNGTTLSPNNFTRTGYKFIGWNNSTTGKAGTYVNFEDEQPISVTRDTTLYAVWKANITNITLNFKNGSSAPNNTQLVNITYDTNKFKQSLTMPSYPGYTFAGYNNSSDGGVQVINSKLKLVGGVENYTTSGGMWNNTSSDITLYAQWIKNQTDEYSSGSSTQSTMFYGYVIYTVYFDSAGGSHVDNQTDLRYGEKVKEPDDPTKDGFIFDAWYTADAYKWDFRNDTVNDTFTLYAKWKLIEVQQPPAEKLPCSWFWIILLITACVITAVIIRKRRDKKRDEKNYDRLS